MHEPPHTFLISLLSPLFPGITIVIGGQLFSWNATLSAGYWEAFLCMLLTGFGYISLLLVLSEMTSAFPLSGGSYGFVRASIGPFFGYLDGCAEAMQSIAYVASSVIPLAQMVTLAIEKTADWEPAYWVVFFVTSIYINVAGGKLFWWFNRIIGMVSLLLIILYILAAIKFCDFSKFSEGSIKDYKFDGHAFIVQLPVAAWWYVGSESLPLACVDCSDVSFVVPFASSSLTFLSLLQQPKTQLPIGMMACILTLFVTANCVFFTTTSQAPGTSELSTFLLPLNPGYTKSLGISDADAVWLAIPAAYATAFGFMFTYGRQMCSMARSGLFPPIFKHRTKGNQSPYSALIFGSILAIVGVIWIYYQDLTFVAQIFYICAIASYSVYVLIFISYIIFVYRFSSVQRAFRNPFGILSSIYGIIFFSIGLVSMIFYGTSNVPIIFFVLYMVMCTVYYYFFGFKTQKLSEEEQKAMFTAYVINGKSFSKVFRMR